MANQLMLRGGAAAPEDQIWVNKLMAAYHATSDVAYDAGENIGDPWAADTQAAVFETTPTEQSSNGPLELAAAVRTAEPPAVTSDLRNRL